MKKPNCKPRRVVLGEGVPCWHTDSYVSLNPDGGNVHYLLSKVAGKRIRLIAEILPESHAVRSSAVTIADFTPHVFHWRKDEWLSPLCGGMKRPNFGWEWTKASKLSGVNCERCLKILRSRK